MPWFQELTQWDNPQQQNHCYLLNDSRSQAWAYAKFGGNQVDKFSSSMNFSVRGRKFKKIPDRWNIELDQETQGRTWNVTGSRGDNYLVSLLNNKWTCSCSGFTFRNRCRHVEQIKAQHR